MRYITTRQPVVEAARHIAATITSHLTQGDRVLWLLSGGSGAAVALAVARQLASIDLHNLSITMTDERYGPIGHPDENWQQIINAGFSTPNATLYRPLSGQNRPDAVAAWTDWLQTQLAQAQFSIGIFGIGPDGHTAGIKPHSSAVHAIEPIVAFTGNDFERLTVTFPTIRRLDELVIQASGDDKAAVIRQLVSGHVSLDDLPAQILTTVPTSTLYTTIPKEESL